MIMIKEQDMFLAQKIIKSSNPKDVALELAIRIRVDDERKSLEQPECAVGFYLFCAGIVLGFVFGLLF